MERPDVIGQARRHGRGPFAEDAGGDLLPQRPHRPAEIIRVHREIARGVVRVPVLAEAIGLPQGLGRAQRLGLFHDVLV